MLPFKVITLALLGAVGDLGGPVLPAADTEDWPVLPAVDIESDWHDMTPRGIRAGKLQAPLELRVGRPRR